MNKKQLVEQLEIRLAKYSYKRVPLTPSEALALFYKRIDSLILTLGIETSRYYKESFSGSFYLSKTFTWSYAVGDFPEIAYQRIGEFLTKQERSSLLDKEFNEKGVTDAWWKGYTEENIDKFCKAVELTQSKFLEQKNIKTKVEKSAEIQELLVIIGTAKEQLEAKKDAKDMGPYQDAVKKAVKSNRDFDIWNNKDGISFLANELWSQMNLK